MGTGRKIRTSLNFKCIENVEFTYPETQNAIMDYLSTLDGDEGTLHSKQSRIWDLFGIVKNALSTIDICKITRKTVFNMLTSDWSKVGTMIELNRFLDFCIGKDLLTDADLAYIVKIKANSGLTNKNYVELLQAPDVYKYFIRKSTVRNTTDLLFTNVQNIEVRKVVQEYAIQSTFRGSQFNTFLNEFDNSLGGLDVQDIYDFSLETFHQQIDFFSKFESDVNKLLTYVNGFYMHVAVKHNPKIFESDGIDSRLLQRPGLAHNIADGYRIVKLNPIEDVPTADKWILCFDADKYGNSNVKTSNSLLLDFTSFECTTYRNWFKHYMWKSHQDLYSRTHCMHSAKLFFNYIYDLKTGKELSMYSKPTKDESISVNEVVAYKNYVMRIYDNNRTRNANIYNPRQILIHLRDNNITEIPNGVFYYLTHELDNSYDNRKAIPDDELKKIAAVLKKKAETRLEFALAHLAFYIGLETEFRSSQIFSLKKDCVVETAKKGEYCIVSKTKTSAGETVEQPITIYVKRHIDEVLKLTEGIRKDTADGISDYLFIAHGSKLGTYKIYNVSCFNTLLQECCVEAGVPPYAYNNLRYTHMTKAEEYIIRNQLSDMEQNVLSGHKSPNTDNKHYIDTSIVELLESVHGVVIGNVDIDGKIKESLPEDVQNAENSVSNNCGYCGCKQCTDYSFLDCMMCKDFVTTIDRLPYFQEQIKILDEKIKNTSIPHDKEDLVNIKRLHLGFISKILELKKQKGENVDAQ